MDTLLKFSNNFLKLCTNKKLIGAGFLFICSQDNTALFLLRSQLVKEPNTWGIPGGSIEKGESPKEAAIRETNEEVGSMPVNNEFIDLIINFKYGYEIFILDISFNEKKLWSSKFRLNKEHSNFKWFKLGEFPINLHSPIKILE